LCRRDNELQHGFEIARSERIVPGTFVDEDFDRSPEHPVSFFDDSGLLMESGIEAATYMEQRGASLGKRNLSAQHCKTRVLEVVSLGN